MLNRRIENAMIRVSAALYALVLLLSAAGLCKGAGPYSHTWKREGIGHVISFAEMQSGSEIVVAATEAGLVAGINGTTGELLWRAIGREHDIIVAVTRLGSYAAVASISPGPNSCLHKNIIRDQTSSPFSLASDTKKNNGAHVMFRVLNVNTGKLLRVKQRRVASLSPKTQERFCQPPLSLWNTVVLSTALVSSVTAAEHNGENSFDSASSWAAALTSEQLDVVELEPTLPLHKTQRITSFVATELVAGIPQLANKSIRLWDVKPFRNAFILLATVENGSTLEIILIALNPRSAVPFAVHSIRNPNLIAFASEGFSQIQLSPQIDLCTVTVSSGNKQVIKTEFSLPNDSSDVSYTHVSAKMEPVSRDVLWTEAGDIRVKGVNKGILVDVSPRRSLFISGNGYGRITAAVSWKGKKPGEHHLIVSYENMALEGFFISKSDEGSSVWVREEALSSISSAVIYNRLFLYETQKSVAGTLLAKSKSFCPLFHPLASRNWLPNMFSAMRQKEGDLLERLLRFIWTPPVIYKKKAAERDAFLIVSTSGGRSVFALDTNNGRPVWKVSDPSWTSSSNANPCLAVSNTSSTNQSVGDGDTVLSSLSNAEQQSYTWTKNLASAAQILLVDLDKHTNQFRDAFGPLDRILAVYWPSSALISWISPRTGVILSSVTSHFSSCAPSVKLAPYVDSSGSTRHVVLVDSESRTGACLIPGKLHCFKEGVEGLTVFAVANDVELKGYQVIGTPPNSTTRSNNYTLQSFSESWNINFSPVNQHILTAKASVAEPFSVETVIAGNGLLLEKLFTSNHVAVVTADRATKQLQVYLIDAYYGRVVLSQKLPPQADSPVYLLLKGHRLIVVYKNTERFRFELLSLELYHRNLSKSADSFTALVNWFRDQKKAVNKPFLFSFDPLFFSRTYILSAGTVRALSFAQTSLGVTPQPIIIANEEGQLVTLSHSVVSGRRPYPPALLPPGVSQDPSEEGLPLYGSMISSTSAADLLSRNTPVVWVRHIFSAADRLESSSVVFAYGLDLFFRVIQPASAFDAVGDDFNQPLIVSIIVVTIALIFFARWKAVEASEKMCWA